ncbi:MAG: hypothetical protein IJ654_05435 [Bacteroidales bacterium]|nr:hypothetical protein [Bacteroidales bacterium]
MSRRLSNGRPVTASYDTDNHSFDPPAGIVEPGTPAPEHLCRECDHYIINRPLSNCSRTYGGATGPLRPACKHFTQKTPTTMKHNNDTAPAAAQVQEPPTTKVCKTCGRELPAEAFGKHFRSADGLQSSCRECMSKLVRASWKGGRKRKSETPAPEAPAAPAPHVTVNPFVTEISDRDLAKELRRRGYVVQCKKIVEL